MSRGRRIARIKLVPPSPTAADKYLLEWDNRELYRTPQDFPKLTKETLFNQPGAMVLEIGCGTGEYLIDAAATEPGECFLGVEISRRSIFHAVNQAEKQRLDNLKFIKADIRLLYPLMVPLTWKQIILNFPDPNYAAGRRKHRIFAPDFLDACYHSLLPEGQIRVVTDQHPFLLDMLSIAESDRRFEKSHPQRYLETFPHGQKTRFQQAWERFDRPIFQFELKISAQ